MKKSTEYAKRLSDWWAQHEREVPPAGESDPVAVLVLAQLSRSVTVTRATDALKLIREDMVDFNELRVTPEPDIAELIGQRVTEPLSKASDLCKCLGSLFETRHRVSLEHLVGKPKKELRAALEAIPRVDPYVASVVMLHGMGQHAVPLDEDVLAAMQHEGILPREADPAELSAWMERQIPHESAHAFWVVSKMWVTGELATLTGKGKATKPKPAAPAVDESPKPKPKPTPAKPAAKVAAKPARPKAKA